ncbi:hypothetical protein EGLA_24100 [Enterococcus gallinarum]|jgi:uncharacterized protein YacL|nr:hypothetical protein AH4_33640 [Enterococcus gallinarum]
MDKFFLIVGFLLLIANGIGLILALLTGNLVSSLLSVIGILISTDIINDNLY